MRYLVYNLGGIYDFSAIKVSHDQIFNQIKNKKLSCEQMVSHFAFPQAVTLDREWSPEVQENFEPWTKTLTYDGISYCAIFVYENWQPSKKYIKKIKMIIDATLNSMLKQDYDNLKSIATKPFARSSVTIAPTIYIQASANELQYMLFSPENVEGRYDKKGEIHPVRCSSEDVRYNHDAASAKNMCAHHDALRYMPYPWPKTRGTEKPEEFWYNFKHNINIANRTSQGNDPGDTRVPQIYLLISDHDRMCSIIFPMGSLKIGGKKPGFATSCLIVLDNASGPRLLFRGFPDKPSKYAYVGHDQFKDRPLSLVDVVTEKHYNDLKKWCENLRKNEYVIIGRHANAIYAPPLNMRDVNRAPLDACLTPLGIKQASFTGNFIIQFLVDKLRSTTITSSRIHVDLFASYLNRSQHTCLCIASSIAKYFIQSLFPKPLGLLMQAFEKQTEIAIRKYTSKKLKRAPLAEMAELMNEIDNMSAEFERNLKVTTTFERPPVVAVYAKVLFDVQRTSGDWEFPGKIDLMSFASNRKAPNENFEKIEKVEIYFISAKNQVIDKRLHDPAPFKWNQYFLLNEHETTSDYLTKNERFIMNISKYFSFVSLLKDREQIRQRIESTKRVVQRDDEIENMKEELDSLKKLKALEDEEERLKLRKASRYRLESRTFRVTTESRIKEIQQKLSMHSRAYLDDIDMLEVRGLISSVTEFLKKDRRLCFSIVYTRTSADENTGVFIRHDKCCVNYKPLIFYRSVERLFKTLGGSINTDIRSISETKEIETLMGLLFQGMRLLVLRIWESGNQSRNHVFVLSCPLHRSKTKEYIETKNNLLYCADLLPNAQEELKELMKTKQRVGYTEDINRKLKKYMECPIDVKDEDIIVIQSSGGPTLTFKVVSPEGKVKSLVTGRPEDKHWMFGHFYTLILASGTGEDNDAVKNYLISARDSQPCIRTVAYPAYWRDKEGDGIDDLYKLLKQNQNYFKIENLTPKSR